MTALLTFFKTKWLYLVLFAALGAAVWYIYDLGRDHERQRAQLLAEQQIRQNLELQVEILEDAFHLAVELQEKLDELKGAFQEVVLGLDNPENACAIAPGDISGILSLFDSGDSNRNITPRTPGTPISL